LSSPEQLTKPQQAIFNLTVAKHGHLKAGDVMMIAAFAIATSKVFELAKTDDIAGFDKVCRLQAMYATRLRISPQACVDPQSIGRRRKDDHQAAMQELLMLNDELYDDCEPQKPWEHFSESN
jgi:hypothetical protein